MLGSCLLAVPREAQTLGPRWRRLLAPPLVAGCLPVVTYESRDTLEEDREPITLYLRSGTWPSPFQWLASARGSPEPYE
ncbi:hypothetical protein ACRE_059630 [Hapsidospora chrysogenum ATCC 11550]|uniref:Uncharacterized protein n=1 Tax=Hapsidospora chrysogenum (strain ATCC 11550 / CBS 779.69 / DSM 880 / IAM 14645 / JCM 23072 / IMI 49137) TaxID=857340 RepID=A0A086T1M1_HAPC1|nr:hypothetical protein ACRE_059630 [Hapsidospora chrysogenum ATCC 11550]